MIYITTILQYQQCRVSHELHLSFLHHLHATNINTPVKPVVSAAHVNMRCSYDDNGYYKTDGRMEEDGSRTFKAQGRPRTDCHAAYQGTWNPLLPCIEEDGKRIEEVRVCITLLFYFFINAPVAPSSPIATPPTTATFVTSNSVSVTLFICCPPDAACV